jgi:signal transduction histidine kinase
MRWTEYFRQAGYRVAQSLGLDAALADGLAPAREALFRDYARRLTITGLRVMAVVMFVLTVLAWPTDWLIFESGSHAMQAIFSWRLWVIGSSVFGFLMLSASRFFSSRPFCAALIFVGVPIAASGYLMGSIGGAASPSTYGIYTIPLLTVLLVARLPVRIAVTTLFVVAYHVAYYAANPAHFGDSSSGTLIVWSCASAIAAIAAGHEVYLLLYANFFQRQKLDTFSTELKIQVAEQTAEIREMATGLSTVQEQERARIARDLHDELGQKLVGLAMELQWVKKKLVVQIEPSAPASQGLQRALEQVDGIHSSIDDILNALRPRALTELGLDSALSKMVQEVAEKNGFKAVVEIEINLEALSETASVVLFRIVQELVTNVARHAQATRAVVVISSAGDGILLSVSDDGVGFQVHATGEKGRMGLVGIVERSHLLGGTCEIDSNPGTGTRITILFPPTRLYRGTSE